MNNLTAAILAILLTVLAGADWIFNDAATLTFLGKKLIDLIEYVAFWR